MNNLQQTDDMVVAENQYWVDMYRSLEKLKENKDFKRVILEGYFKDKAINGVSMLANQGVISNGVRPQVMEDLVAISKLQDFFITIDMLGNIPEEDEDEETGV